MLSKYLQQPWYQRRQHGFNSQNQRPEYVPQGAEALSEDQVGDLASALEKALDQHQESVNASRAHSLPPPINKQQQTAGPQNR